MDIKKRGIGCACKRYSCAVFLGFVLCMSSMNVADIYSQRPGNSNLEKKNSSKRVSTENRTLVLPCNQSCVNPVYPFYSTACSCSNVNTTKEEIIIRKALGLRDRKCFPKRHVFYLKTFKTASSTVTNILYRFALERNLRVLQFTHWHVLKKQFLLNHTLDYTFGKLKANVTTKYDMLMDHIIYDRKFVQRFLPSDTVFITSIRNPWERLNSHLNFFTKIYSGAEEFYGLNKNKELPLNVQFVQNLQQYGDDYEKKLSSEMAVFSLRNQMSKQFGVSQGLTLQSSLKHVKDEFPLIILQEYFDESLLLLKRKLCWSMADILCTKLRKKKCSDGMNCGSGSDRKFQVYERKFRQWSSADYHLYEALNSSFWKSIKQQYNFFKELAYFKHINSQVNKWCQREVFDFIERNPNEVSNVLEYVNEEILVISETQFNRRIVFDKLRCLLMRVDGNVWKNLFRFRQFPQLCEMVDKRHSYNPKTFDFVVNGSLWANRDYCNVKSSCCNFPLDILKYKKSFI